MLCDSYQRKIDYVRLSITDRCNLRCQYCMPLNQNLHKQRRDLLSFEEITQLIKIFSELGVRSVRITGGEPLVRKGTPELVSKLKSIGKLEDILLTSNAQLLEGLAQDLKKAGLTRINIHLDSLNSTTYQQLMRWGHLEKALAGIRAAHAAGFLLSKLNTVVMKGINDHEVEDLVLFAAHNNLTARFIELMPIGPGASLKKHFISSAETRNRLARRFTLIPYGKKLGRGPADYYKIVELDSVVGFIHPVSEPFCEKCNRIRISADGRIQDCLAYDESVNFCTILRNPDLSEEEIKDKIINIIGGKREDHGGFLLPQYKATAGMYGIGG
jgi:GTP 3',8-cyclase